MRGVQFEALGEVRTLAFTTGAMMRYQRAAGETLIAGVVAVERDATDAVRVIRIVGAGLGGGLTEDQVCEIIDAVGYAEAIKLIGAAFQDAFPPPADAGNASAGKPKRTQATP